MITSTSNIAEDLLVLPQPKVFLLYGKAKLLFQPEERLFQWQFGKQQRVHCIESADDTNNSQKKAKEALQALKDTCFKPVIIFDKGESSNALQIFDYNLPDFAILEVEDDPEEVEYALCNPEASVEAIWFPLLEGETIAEPPAIWRDPKFLGNYGDAFLQWLRRHPERHGMEPLADLKLDDFTIDIPQPEGHFRLGHQFFPLAWLDIVRGSDGCQARPGGALDGIEADELYILHDNMDMALTEVSGNVWDYLLGAKDNGLSPILGKSKWIDPSTEAVKGPSKLKQAQDWLIDFIVRDPIKIAFASDGRHNEGGFGPYELLGGDSCLTVEYIPDDPAWKIIKVKFSEHRIAEFQGRRMAVGIAGIRYDLGEVNWRGIAEGEIPGDLDLAQLDYVYYGKPLDSQS